MYATGITSSQIHKILPIRDGRPPASEGRSPNSKRPRKSWDSLSREAQKILEQLACDNTGSVGVECGARIQSTIYKRTAATTSSYSHRTVEGGRGPYAGGDTRDARERSNLGGPSHGAGLCIERLPRPEKRRRSETSHQSEEIKRICSDGTLQDGGHSCSQGPTESRRLYGQNRPQGCVLHGTDPQGGQSLPQIRIPGQDIQVQLPPVRSGMRAMGVHKNPETGSRTIETNGRATDRLHRRYPHHGRDPTYGSGTCPGISFPIGKPGVRDKSSKMCTGTHTTDGIPGIHCELHRTGAPPTNGESEEDQGRDPKTSITNADRGEKTLPDTRQTERSNKGSPAGPPVLPQFTDGPKQCIGQFRPGLLGIPHNNSTNEGGAAMVVGPPDVMERQNTDSTEAITCDRIRCFENRMGCSVQGIKDRRPLVEDRAGMAHQLPGSIGSLPSRKVLCQRQKEPHHPPQDGQYDSSNLCKQTGWNCITLNEQHSQRAMDVVHEQRYHHHGGTPARDTEHNSGRRVSSDERQVGLDAESTDFQENPTEVGATGGRHVCITTIDPAPEILQLETRPGSGSSECICTGLESPPRLRLCQPTMGTDQQGSDTGTGSESHNNPSRTSLEGTDMVPQTSGHAGGLSPQDPTNQGPSSPGNREQTRGDSTAGRLEYLRRRFKDQSISEEGTELLLASWRQKSSQSYDSLFRKWVCWCNGRNSDPVSGPVSDIINFLAHLYNEGYQYRSLNAYRSAISSVHEKIDGYEVGQHPLVSRLLKGVFNSRPPQPRYEATWDVSVVLKWIEDRGENATLSLQDLTFKLVMLLALTRPSRSSDLANLDIRFRRYIPEGVTFQPVALAKQSRQSKERAEFFFPAFPSNPVLCPVVTLRAYEERTKNFRHSKEGEQHKLLLATVKPHRAVAPSSIARWLRTVLEKAGIDSNIFKAHSTRGASTSAAAKAGVTTADILNAADWSSESTFQKFYYKPTKNPAFGTAVLSTKQ